VQIHYYLDCVGGHHIPLPRPSLIGTEANPLEMPKDGKTATFVCPECGLVSAYSREEIRWMPLPTADPFRTCECALATVAVECDGKDCTAQKELHMVRGTATGTWTPTIVPRQWTFSENARCPAGHRMFLDKNKEHQVQAALNPF
jgi:hypothetical protein